MLASLPESMLNHIYAKKGFPYRFILGQKDSKAVALTILDLCIRTNS